MKLIYNFDDINTIELKTKEFKKKLLLEFIAAYKNIYSAMLITEEDIQKLIDKEILRRGIEQ